MEVRTTPHLEEGEERAGRVRVRACPGAHGPERRGAAAQAGSHGARPRSTAPLLTPAALLIDANGSVRSRRSLSFLSYGNSKLKKNPEAAVGSLVQWM